MIYLVSQNKELFENTEYKHLTVEESLNLMKDWGRIQFDSETTGVDPHVDTLLCAQFGNDSADARIVIDCTTIDISFYKNKLETTLIIGHNLKFDLQFLYNYQIKPLKIYDTMIVEQLLYLGYPPGSISYSLSEVAQRRLNVYIDKTVRGQIIWRGLDTKVIKYAASDVQYLERIMLSQFEDCKLKQCLVGAKLECDTVPSVAYLEWCGIMLDATKWEAKMEKDLQDLEDRRNALNKFVVDNPLLKEFVYVNTQGDLFTGFDLTPKCLVNWDSPKQVVTIAKLLGFNTTTQDKKTGEDKDSVLEKVLIGQTGINDEFLELYFSYREASKLVTTYGATQLNMINPNTNRCHTVYRQLGTSSGRFACGSKNSNKSLAKLKGLPQSACTYANFQQLPNDHVTRSCFVSPPGYKFVSADFSAEEARLGGDIYQDEAILKIFREGIDSHSMYAKIFFKEELKDIDVHDIKKLRPDLRQKAKGPEFALNFGGGVSAIMSSIHCTEEEANTIIKNYEEGFKGTTEFAKKGAKLVRQNGYVLINPITGHKMYWHDWEDWKARQASFTKEFWEDYRINHKGKNTPTAQLVKYHSKAASKWDRMARNAPCQGTAAIILKTCMVELFKWIIDNDLFNKVHLCAVVHDEIVCDFPEELNDFPEILTNIMEASAAKYCKSLPIPAEASVGTYWEH